MHGVRDTIVAVASPPGRGLRVLVRASGPGVRDVAHAAFGFVPSARGVIRTRVHLPTQRNEPALEFPALAFWME